MTNNIYKMSQLFKGNDIPELMKEVMPNLTSTSLSELSSEGTELTVDIKKSKDLNKMLDYINLIKEPIRTISLEEMRNKVKNLQLGERCLVVDNELKSIQIIVSYSEEF